MSINKTENSSLTKRRVIEYNEYDKVKYTLQKNTILSQIKENIHEEKAIIYENQNNCARQIVASFGNRKIINILIIALTQSGKTGTMCALIRNYLNDEENIIPKENIYIITGLSSKEWVEQTKERLPECLEKRVIHRGKLNNKFTKEIKNKKNILVIIDEIQVAAKNNQSLAKKFKVCGFYDKQYLLENDIKIVEFSATPDGVVCDLNKVDWEENSYTHIMQPGDRYTSCFDLRKQKRVFQCKDLYCYNKENDSINYDLVDKNIGKVKKIISDKFEEPMYHIIRTPTGSAQSDVINNFKRVFGKDNIGIISYTQESNIDDINKILEKEPKKHTFIFIKEMLRCAKTIIKTYLGILYERDAKNPNDSVMIQGLLGRATGYDDNHKSIVFTNIVSIEKYERMWESEFKEEEVRWNSNTTKFKKNTLESKGTVLSPEKIDGMDSNDITEIEPIIEKFDTHDEAKVYFKKYLRSKFGGRGPNKKTLNPNGFYETSIRGIVKIYSYTEIEKEKKWGFGEKNKYRYYPCYDDVTDKSTVKFVLIYYE